MRNPDVSNTGERALLRYTVLLDYDPDVDAYAVTVPALPGCFSQGATVDEAVEHAKEAIAGFVAVLAKRGEDVPVEEPLLLPIVVEVEADVPVLAATG